jgi:hypothetical protein
MIQVKTEKVYLIQHKQTKHYLTGTKIQRIGRIAVWNNDKSSAKTFSSIKSLTRWLSEQRNSIHIWSVYQNYCNSEQNINNIVPDCDIIVEKIITKTEVLHSIDNKLSIDQLPGWKWKNNWMNYFLQNKVKSHYAPINSVGDEETIFPKYFVHFKSNGIIEQWISKNKSLLKGEIRKHPGSGFLIYDTNDFLLLKLTFGCDIKKWFNFETKQQRGIMK